MRICRHAAVDVGPLLHLPTSPGGWIDLTFTSPSLRCRPNADTTKAMAKMIKQEGEATKVAVRAARKLVMEQVKRLPSKDAQRQLEKQVTMAHESPSVVYVTGSRGRHK